MKSSPSSKISLGADPNAEPKSPPLIIDSKVLSSVGVKTPSSSNGINSTNVPAAGIVPIVNDVVDPSPLNTSVLLTLVLSADVR